MNNDKVIMIKKIKKILLISTITLFSISAFLGIIFVLVGVDSTAWKIIGTTAILGLLSLLSMNNVFRLESEQKQIKILSITALISNIFWSIPWIFIVWDIFRTFMCDESTVTGYYGYSYRDCSRSFYDFMEFIYKLVGTAGIISATTTVVANFLNMKNYSSAIKALKITAISSAIFLGAYFLPAIWFEDGGYISDTWRLIAVVAIIFVFSSIITPILAKIAKNKEKNSNAAPRVDEVQLREQIEAEVRAKIAQEQLSDIRTDATKTEQPDS